MITEEFDNRTKQFILKADGVIDSVQFRDMCKKQFGTIVLKVEHCEEDGVWITKGYSKRIY